MLKIGATIVARVTVELSAVLKIYASRIFVIVICHKLPALELAKLVAFYFPATQNVLYIRQTNFLKKISTM